MTTVGWQLKKSAFVHLQRVDSKYATTDFSSFSVGLDYFVDLWGATPTSPRASRRLVIFFRHVSAFADGDEALRQAAHAIMCDAAEKVHDILGRKIDVEPWESGTTKTVEKTSVVLCLALQGLIQLITEELDDKADEILRANLRYMKELMAAQEKDAEKNHQVLG